MSSYKGPAQHKLFVLFTAGRQVNEDKPILPKDAARLLKVGSFLLNNLSYSLSKLARLSG